MATFLGNFRATFYFNIWSHCKSVTFGVGTNVEFINDECGTLGIATLVFNQQRTEANQITELKYFLNPAQSIKYGSVFFISYSVNKIK